MDEKDADNQQTFAVSRILEHRTKGPNEHEYLVRWKNETNDTEMEEFLHFSIISLIFPSDQIFMLIRALCPMF